MTRFQHLQTLFHEALEVPVHERAAFLDRACAGDDELRRRVEALLEHDTGDEDGVTLMARVAPIAQSLADRAVDGGIGDRIGGYRLLREIGSGGMGTVFLAERDDLQFRHQVAIKLVRGFPTAAVLERCRRERELLATLRHPNIARLFDGGTTESGQPYLVMEYVDGTSLDAWSRQQQPTLRQRLKLFQSLCSAVEHAHQQLIVHRDLKPANVLVRPDGEPVLLDFGIGKLLDDGDAVAEATQFRALTPAYASPEQLRGEVVTTLSDVYGLGLILFELLTGSPLRKSSGETTRLAASRVAASADADWLRQEARTLRGDLDNIVRKALREEPQRRYAGAGALAADIEAWFHGRPVAAAPDSLRYRMVKFAARHPIALGATVATIAMLSILSARLAIERDRALAAQEQARLEAEGASQSAAFLVDLFKSAAPETTRGRELTVRALVEGAQLELAGREFSRPAIKSQLERSVGEIYFSLGLLEDSVRMLEQATARLRTDGADSDSDQLELARGLWQLARAYADLGHYEASRRAAEEALSIKLARLPAGDPEIAHSLTTLGVPEVHLGLHEQAQQRFREAEALFRAAGEPYRQSLAAALHNQGWAARSQGDTEAARRLLDQSLAMKQELLGTAHPSTFVTLQVMAALEADLGEFEQAQQRLQQLLAAQMRLLGEPSSRVASTHNELGSVLQDSGRYPDAERHYRAAISQHQQLEEGGTGGQAIAINNLGTLLEDAEDHAEAERMYRSALTMRIESGASERAIARGRHNLARVLVTMGRLEEAQPLADASLAMRRDLPAAARGEQIDALLLQARIAIGRSDADAAEDWLRQALELDPAAAAGNHRVAEMQAQLAHIAGDLETEVRARTLQLSALRSRLPARHPQIARVELLLAAIAGGAGMSTPELRAASDVLRANLHPDGPTRILLARMSGN